MLSGSLSASSQKSRTLEGGEVGEVITRQQACKRLLRAAIKSFVRGDEPLSTHLCIQAAFRVCRDIVKKRDPQTDWFTQIIRPERLREFIHAHARLANFLKHADKDPAEAIDLHDLRSRNEHDIILLYGYYELAFREYKDAYLRSYFYWYSLKYPELTKSHSEAQIASRSIGANAIDEAWESLRFLVDADADLLEEAKLRMPELDW